MAAIAIPTSDIKVNGAAALWLMQATPAVRQYVVDTIKEQAPCYEQHMVVIGWTFDLPDHIYRSMKLYRYSPGIRVIYHKTRHGLSIDKIGWRDQDVYSDGH